MIVLHTHAGGQCPYIVNTACMLVFPEHACTHMHLEKVTILNITSYLQNIIVFLFQIILNSPPIREVMSFSLVCTILPNAYVHRESECGLR